MVSKRNYDLIDAKKRNDTYLLGLCELEPILDVADWVLSGGVTAFGDGNLPQSSLLHQNPAMHRVTMRRPENQRRARNAVKVIGKTKSHRYDHEGGYEVAERFHEPSQSRQER